MPLVIIKDSKYVEEKLLAEVAGEVFSFLGEEFEVNLKFACENCIRGLNKQYRSKDEPTNVLSFNSTEGAKDGDIVICEDVVERETKQLGYEVKELNLLYLIHGMLHLAGFDHQNTSERAKMEAIEEEILAKIGINIVR